MAHFDFASLRITDGYQRFVGTDRPQLLTFQPYVGYEPVDCQFILNDRVLASVAESKLSIGQAGWYRVCLDGYFDEFTVGKKVEFALYRTGKQYQGARTAFEPVTNQTSTHVHLERIMWLDKSDYLQVFVDTEEDNGSFRPVNVEFFVTPLV